MQRLLKLLLLLQVSENLPADALQALHLPLALVHLPLQGFDSQGQLWEGGEREEKGRGGEGVRGEHGRSEGWAGARVHEGSLRSGEVGGGLLVGE